MQQPDPMSALTSDSLETWRPWLDPDAASMLIVAGRSIELAAWDQKAGEIVIDKLSVVRTILAYGASSSGNAAAWVTEYFATPRRMADIPARGQSIMLKAHRAGAKVVLSRSLRNVVLPLAQRHAQATMGHEKIGLRHLVVALLDVGVSAWQGSLPGVSSTQILGAKKGVIAATIANAMPSENIVAWRTILGEPEEIPTRAKGTSIRKPPKINSPTPTTPVPTPATVPMHTDDPAIVDLLGRKGFATVLANRIVEARKKAVDESEQKQKQKQKREPGDNRAFIVHMHGPWGSGKSTVLNFVRDDLEARHGGAAGPAWLVVEFNAWRSQRLKPAWWPLILQIEQAALASEPRWWARGVLRAKWYFMRARANLLPLVIGVVAIIAAGVLLGWASLGGEGEPLKGVAALLTAVAGIYSFSRSLLFGAGQAVKAFDDLQSDPYGPMMTLFCRLIDAIGKPVIVFVDDLDRCDHDYVCDLLESIQTMLRSAHITYLIAADRKWICTSFEERYDKFSAVGGEAGRPLGYQFLDKLFQVSVTLPVIPARLRDGFWDGLLFASGSTDAPKKPEGAEAEAATKLDAAATPEAKSAAIHAETDVHVQQAMVVKLGVEQASPEARADFEHRLKPFGPLLDPNPRSMKRLANAVGMNQSRMTFEGRHAAAPEAIARWTILELRWPLLADWLVDEPERLGWSKGKRGVDEGDRAMLALMHDPDVQRAIGGGPEEGRLTVAVLRELTV